MILLNFVQATGKNGDPSSTYTPDKAAEASEAARQAASRHRHQRAAEPARDYTPDKAAEAREAARQAASRQDLRHKYQRKFQHHKVGFTFPPIGS